VERVEVEPLGLLCPYLADVFVWGEALEGLEPAAEVVGRDEVGEVTSKLVMGVVVVALDDRLPEGAVHTFDLPVGLWMPRFGQAMIDVVLSAGELEGMGVEDLTALQRQLDLGCG
jgi:hypothetical protein